MRLLVCIAVSSSLSDCKQCSLFIKVYQMKGEVIAKIKIGKGWRTSRIIGVSPSLFYFSFSSK